MINKETVRRAMDARLAALTASEARRAAIRRKTEGEEKMKRKVPAGLVLAAALLLALAGAALAVGTNLFEHFGAQDARYAKIAGQSVTVTAQPVTVQDEINGEASAAIDSVYYDGQNLSVAFIIRNGSRMEAYAPTPQQLARMTRAESAVFTAAASAQEAALLAEYHASVEAGVPSGYAHYSVYASDHTFTEEGIDLAPRTAMQDTTAEGDFYEMREYETPLPAGAQDRAELTVRIPLYQSVSYVWFDGEAYYTDAQRQEVGEITATVPRAAGENKRTLTGMGTMLGANCTVTAEATAMLVTVTVTADAPVFTALEHEYILNGETRFFQESEYCLALSDDATGETLRVDEQGAYDPCVLRVIFAGTGALPERLTVYPVRADAGEEESILREQAIVLTP